MTLHAWAGLLPGQHDEAFLQASQPALRCAHQILDRRIGGAHFRQHRFGWNAAVHQPDTARLAIHPLDTGQEVAQGPTVVRVAGQHFICDRQSVRCHHERDHHLNAVRPVIARIAEAALVAFGERRAGFKVSAGQIVEQHVETDVEQVVPALPQVLEQRVLMREQTIMTGIQLVDLGEIGAGAQQIAQCRAGEPSTVQPPLAARCDKPVGGQYEQHLIPARAFTIGWQP